MADLVYDETRYEEFHSKPRYLGCGGPALPVVINRARLITRYDHSLFAVYASEPMMKLITERCSLFQWITINSALDLSLDDNTIRVGHVRPPNTKEGLMEILSGPAHYKHAFIEVI